MRSTILTAALGEPVASVAVCFSPEELAAPQGPGCACLPTHVVNRVLELQKVKDRPVVIAADRNVKYDEVVGLLGALHAQGVKRVGLVAKEGG